MESEKLKSASIKLSILSNDDKSIALRLAREAIDKNRTMILKANHEDLKNAKDLLKEDKISKANFDRLRLDDSKIDQILKYFDDVEELDDPTNKILSEIELDKDLILTQKTCPIGVIAVIFESRPDVLPQIFALALKSGNALVMKGGKEADKTNTALFKTIIEAVKENIPVEAFVQIHSRKEVKNLLEMNKTIDLIIPRGSNKFVKFIQENTTIPVLGHSDGICHIYIDQSADFDEALKICIDAKTNYPSACNAVETILVNEKISRELLPQLINAFKENSVKVNVCKESYKIVNSGITVTDDWRVEHASLEVSIKIVKDLFKATEHINTYSSHHTDSIITGSEEGKELFNTLVDSACVFSNCSTRFSDGFVFGKGAEVGISTNKIHARGPVGLEGLIIYKYFLKGKGQVRGDYTGEKSKSYTHKRLK